MGDHPHPTTWTMSSLWKELYKKQTKVASFSLTSIDPTAN